MTDGELAVIGLGTAGSMALWQATKLSGGGGVVGSGADPAPVAAPLAATPDCSA